MCLIKLSIQLFTSYPINMAQRFSIRFLLLLPLLLALVDSYAGMFVLEPDDGPGLTMQIKPYDLPALVDIQISAATEVVVIWPEIINVPAVHTYQPVTVPAIDEVPARCNSPPWVHRMTAFK